jgi:hypothetical protein
VEIVPLPALIFPLDLMTEFIKALFLRGVEVDPVQNWGDTV